MANYGQFQKHLLRQEIGTKMDFIFRYIKLNLLLLFYPSSSSKLLISEFALYWQHCLTGSQLTPVEPDTVQSPKVNCFLIWGTNLKKQPFILLKL